MRGPPKLNRRNSDKPRPINDADGAVTTYPAPLGGWNTRDAFANMPEIDCIVCDNFFPGTSDMKLRNGSLSQSTGLDGAVETLMVYNSGSASKMFAATPAGIYDVSAGGAVGAVVHAATVGRWQYRNFSNTAGSFLTCVNGIDELALYNGTTWQSINAVSVPAITGIATTLFSNVCIFKRRLWFVEKASLNAWYLDVDAIAGAAVKFPFGAIFSRGGYIVAQESWTLDGGNGPDDYLVTATSRGEIAIYKGIDPADSDNFSLVGVFYVGSPVGARCFERFGTDLVLLSQQGCFELSKALTRSAIKRDNQLSYKIDTAFTSAINLYGSNFGWQIIYYPDSDFVLVNVPVLTGVTSHQYVMNTVTKAWCRFIGWNAGCFAEWNGNLYFGGSEEVFQANIGIADDGMAITAEIQQAYSKFKLGGGKQVSLTRLNIGLTGQLTLALRYETDFSNGNTFSSLSLGTTGSSLWDTAIWDASVWGEGSEQLQSRWLHIPNNPGYFQSLRLRLQSNTSTFSWTSTDFVVKPSGIL